MDYSNIFGGSILRFVEETIGSVLNADKPYPISGKGKTKVRAYVASVRDDPESKVLFTLGLFAQAAPQDGHLMKELFLCLPNEWPLPHYHFNGRLREYGLTAAPYFPETLPLDIFGAVTSSIQKKNSAFALNEGTFIDKRKGVYAKFDWPQELGGAAVVDVCWNSENQSVSDTSNGEVTLLTLAPFSGGKKSLTPGWFEARCFARWQDLRFPLFSDVALVEETNRAFLDRDWWRAAEMIEKGVNVNRGVYEPHHMWGDVVSDTYLEKAMKNNVLDLAKLLIERGAKIPHDALAIIADIPDLATFEYLLSLGCSVNAVDNVGYTAMNRAVAFDNQPVIERCKALGGVYREQKHDKTEYLRALRDAGITVTGDELL
jgi:hypothetical protein